MVRSGVAPGVASAWRPRGVRVAPRAITGSPGPDVATGGAIVAPMSVETLRFQRAEFEFGAVRKDARVAYALWVVCGVFGGHRFYLGDTGRSIAMLFTLGGLGVWALVDVFLVGRRVRAVNARRRAAIMARHGIVEAPA
jgi:TM2 domain-containing membrane protein YozV